MIRSVKPEKSSLLEYLAFILLYRQLANACLIFILLYWFIKVSHPMFGKISNILCSLRMVHCITYCGYTILTLLIVNTRIKSIDDILFLKRLNDLSLFV